MFAITFADKEGKKFVFQCREDHEQMLLAEVNSNSTYQFAAPIAGGGHVLAFSKDRCVRDTTAFLIANQVFHRSDVSLDEGNPDYEPELPHLYASIKTHKQAHPGRFIAASRAVTTTGLSRWVSRAFRALLPSMENLWWEEMLRAGVATDPEEGSQSWMVWDGIQVVEKVHRLNKRPGVDTGTGGMAVYDFKTMYPTIPLQDLKARLGSLIREVFQKRNDVVRDSQNRQCQWRLQLTKSQSQWVAEGDRKRNSRWVQTFDADRLCRFLDELVDSTFITLGKVVLWQRIGIPMGTNCAPFLANLYCFSYELAFLRSLVRSQNAQQSGSREHTLIRRMHDASRYIDDLLTMNFPEFENIMYRMQGEVEPQGTVVHPLTGIYPNTFSNGGTAQQGLVLERVQPEYASAEKIVGEVDYLDVTIKRDAHGWHCDLYDKRNAMPSQAGGSRVPDIRTALSEACKYGIVHSQMHRFSRRLRRLPLFCTATGRLLAHMIIHGYDRRKLWLRVKRFSARGIPRNPARRRRMFNRIRQCQEDTLAQHRHK